jgi:hypothetical protein
MRTIQTTPIVFMTFIRSPADLISATKLKEKAERVQSGTALKILYVGRASEMKGPLDWVEAIAKPIQSGRPASSKMGWRRPSSGRYEAKDFGVRAGRPNRIAGVFI